MEEENYCCRGQTQFPNSLINRDIMVYIAVVESLPHLACVVFSSSWMWFVSTMNWRVSQLCLSCPGLAGIIVAWAAIWCIKLAGMSFLFHLAIFCTTTSASSILPVLRSQRGDSGTNHLAGKLCSLIFFLSDDPATAVKI